MIAAIRDRVSSLVDTLGQLDALLEAPGAGDFPALLLARALLDVDTATAGLERHAEALAALGRPE
jgi:hypothetical protein